MMVLALEDVLLKPKLPIVWWRPTSRASGQQFCGYGGNAYPLAAPNNLMASSDEVEQVTVVWQAVSAGATYRMREMARYWRMGWRMPMSIRRPRLKNR